MFLVQPQQDEVPDVWHALGDATRRSLIDRLAYGPKSTSQLCEGMPMTRFGVMKHLSVLERSGLIIARKHGRIRLNHLNVALLTSIQRRWISSRAEGIAAGFLNFADSMGDKAMSGTPNDIPGIVHVALEWPIEASVQAVWRALFEKPELWWPREHRAVGEGAKMKFEARIGGQLREEREDGGGLVWYNVIALDPLRSVDLAGYLAARYGGPASSLLHLEIVPGRNEGTSVLKLTDSVFGRIGSEMRASLSSGWQAIIGEGLVRQAEKGDAR